MADIHLAAWLGQAALVTDELRGGRDEGVQRERGQARGGAFSTRNISMQKMQNNIIFYTGVFKFACGFDDPLQFQICFMTYLCNDIYWLSDCAVCKSHH